VVNFHGLGKQSIVSSHSYGSFVCIPILRDSKVGVVQSNDQQVIWL
jgi:hypothetical protein